MPATRRISTSPSPSRRQCSRSANSRSFNGKGLWRSEYSTRVSGGDALEEGRQPRKIEIRGNLRDACGRARRAARRGSASSAARRRSDWSVHSIRLNDWRAPRHARKWPTDAKRQVYEMRFGPGIGARMAGRDEQRQIDAHPDAVMTSGSAKQAIEGPHGRLKPDRRSRGTAASLAPARRAPTACALRRRSRPACRPHGRAGARATPWTSHGGRHPPGRPPHARRGAQRRTRPAPRAGAATATSAGSEPSSKPIPGDRQQIRS